MRTARNVTFCLLAVCLLALVGCGKKADESRPIGEVKAEAETMDADKLRSMALTYKEAIVSKKGEVEKVAGKIKDIPVAKMLGDEAKELKSEIDTLNKSVSALTERFQVYYDKLKEKGGDTSGLDI